MAGQRVNYITRQGIYSPAEARVRHQGLQHGTDLEREDLVYWRARNLPQWAEEDPVRFFNTAEQHTSPHQIAYEEWKVSLPRELSRRQQMDAARAFLQASFGDRHPYVWALHDPVAADGHRQPHAHILWSARTLDGLNRTEDQFFRRFNRAHPERGGAEKAREFSHFGAVKASRVLYTDVMNLHMEMAGHEARLHPDTLTDRGFDRDPEPRLRPSDSNALKYRYAVTPAMQKVFAHRFARTQSAPVELADAQAYWQRRTVELGITRDMPMDQQLAHIRQARTQAITRIPERLPVHELAREARTLTQSISRLELYSAQLRHELGIEGHFREDYQRPESGKARVERLLAQGPDHGLPRDPQAERAVATFARTLEQLSEEPQAGAALNVRLFREEERGRDQGMSF